MRVISSNSSQLTIDFEPGLAERFPSCMDVVRAGAYRGKKPLKTIAADMDLSQSDLSRKLAENPDDSRRFTVRDLERYIESTGDLTPVHYLVQRYLVPEQRSKGEAAIQMLADLLPEITELVRQARSAA